MTPEREAEAERRLGAGESISQIAEDWDISRQTLYTRFNSDRIAQLREQNAEKVLLKDDGAVDRHLRVIK
jgi:DNA invertase Pin-like site-specific DNA recombinase